MVSNGTFGKNRSLTPRQAGALPHIIAAPSLREGARAAGLSYTTVSRWMHDPRFRAEVEHARQAISSVVYARLQELLLLGAANLEEFLTSDDLRVRLRATRIAFDIALKAELNHDLRKRLDQLSRTLKMIKETR